MRKSLLTPALFAALAVGVIGCSSGPTGAAPAESQDPGVAAGPETSEPTPTPTPTPTESGDVRMKYGQTLTFNLDEQPMTLKVEALKKAANMFDKDNAEARVTACNKGTESVEVSAQGFGLVAVDAKGGEFEPYGSYRKPEFAVYDWDAKTLRAGKCSTGWVGFDGAWKGKATKIAMVVDDREFSWGK